jgi:hypothetical protein
MPQRRRNNLPGRSAIIPPPAGRFYLLMAGFGLFIQAALFVLLAAAAGAWVIAAKLRPGPGDRLALAGGLLEIAVRKRLNKSAKQAAAAEPSIGFEGCKQGGTKRGDFTADFFRNIEPGEGAKEASRTSDSSSSSGSTSRIAHASARKATSRVPASSRVGGEKERIASETQKSLTQFSILSCV